MAGLGLIGSFITNNNNQDTFNPIINNSTKLSTCINNLKITNDYYKT